MKSWFSDGHPQDFHIATLFFAVLSLAAAFSSTILASDTLTSGFTDTTAATSSTTTTASTTTACTYSYTDWGTCQSDGKRYRTVTSTSPTGCVQTSEPKTVESCAYTAPQCGYSYSSWSACQSNGKQTRSLLSKSPSGCVEYVQPVLEQTCTYTASATSSTTTACTYSYTDWGTYQSDGKRYRTVTSTSPTGCVQTSEPKTVESCATTPSTTTTTTADQCVYSYSSWGACESNGKRARSLLAKSPSGCVEYVQPVLEQACVYDGTATTTAVTLSSENLSSETSGDVTPTFSFKNVSDGMTIRGTFEIRGDVRGASGVEYYLVPTGSNTHKYIGSGSKASETEWRLSFRSGEFPNGEFYLRAKIKNIYGEYGSSQRRISIANDRLMATATTTDGFVSLEMSDTEKRDILEQFKRELAIPAEVTSGAASETPDEQKRYVFEYCQTNPEKCAPERDSDRDGLSDVDEIRYGTNPKTADSDLDGFIDGDEVRNGFNPLQYSGGDQSDRIVFESPKVAGETKDKIYAVHTVELKDAGTDEAGVAKPKLQLSGQGLPNSFVTIYVYSDPIVLTVKTDSDGNWTYALDKELEDGEHEVYVAITDNTGKITAKSQPLGFIKTAQAVTVIPSAEAAPLTETLPVSRNRAQKDLLILVAIVIAALAVTLAAIGLMKHRQAVREGTIRL